MEPRRQRTLARACLAVVLSATGAAGAYLRWGPTAALWETEGIAAGVRLDGRELARRGDPSRILEAETASWEREVVTVVAGEQSLRRSWTELGLHADVELTSRRVLGLGRSGSLPFRLVERWRASRGAIDVPRAALFDDAVVDAWLARTKRQVDVPAIDARYDFERQAVVPHRDGRFLDLDGARSALLDAFVRGQSRVELPQRTLTPRLSTDTLSGFAPTEVISRFETHFRRHGKEAPRAKNIEVAAQRLDGAIVLPGALFSFNQIVGERSERNGFHESFQILKGEMVRGMGGGTCQVSSTLHAAAFQAGVDVVERLPHSRPLGYIPLGLDSTVVWPSVDFKFRNPWAFPVVLRAVVEGTKIEVSLLAPSTPNRVTVHRTTLDTSPFRRKVEVSPFLASGKFKKKQEGILGYRVLRTRVFSLPDGTRRVEKSVDRYPPTPELYEVAPDLDPGEDLPPLPEDAIADEPETRGT